MQDIVNPNAAKVDELLGWLLETVKGSTEFVKEQAPTVAQDIVRYGVISNVVWVVVCLSILAVAWVVFLRVGMGAYRREAARERVVGYTLDWNDSSIVMFFGTLSFACLATLICVPTALSAVGPFLKASYAPRLYVLEECMKMIRNK